MRKMCAQCGRNFFTTDSRRKYCSKKCCKESVSAKHRNRYAEDAKRFASEGAFEKTCPICGTVFPINGCADFGKIYCSISCTGNWTKNKQSNIQQSLLDEGGTKLCVVCGKPIPKTRPHAIKYCSQKCKCAYHNRQRKIKYEQNESCPECKNVPEVLPIKSSDNLPVASAVIEKQHYDLHIRAVKDTTGKRYRVDSWINENNPKEQLAELMQQLIRWSFNKAYFTDQEIVEIMTKAYDQSLKDYEE